MTPEEYAVAIDLERRRGLAFVSTVAMLARWSLGMDHAGKPLQVDDTPIYRTLRRRAAGRRR